MGVTVGRVARIGNLDFAERVAVSDQAPGRLTIDNVRVRFADRQALDGVSLRLAAGEALVLLGPNGAGKSTLIKALAGRIVPDTGSVRIGGRDPARDGRARRKLGIVPQHIALFEKLSAIENLHAFGRLMGLGRRAVRERAKATLADVGLADRAHERVDRLSGGMRRRVNIAAALLHEPSILVLDEPTAGVDYRAQAGLIELIRSLKSRGLAILLTTHDMGEAEALADRAAVLVAGRILAEGTPDRLVTDVFQAAREVEIRLSGSVDRESAFVTELERIGLERCHDGRTMRGILRGSDAAFEDLLATAMRKPGTVEDVRIGRPGLEALLKQLVQRDDAGGPTAALAGAGGAKS